MLVRETHGLPRIIVSDRDVKFLSHFWKTFSNKLGPKILFSIIVHLQIDGQTAVMNRILATLLLVYSFNPLTPLDILTLPTNEHANLDGKQKANFVRELHAKVQANIEKRNEQYARKANKGHVKVTFESGDWVWVHMQKKTSEDFDSRINPFEEGGNDRDPNNKAKEDLLHDIEGPMTRSKTKMMNQSLQGLILEIKKSSEQSELEAAPKWVILLQVDDDWSPT
ncbi:hypothetical protein CR513_55560, partial [Mucuna pruriens]